MRGGRQARVVAMAGAAAFCISSTGIAEEGLWWASPPANSSKTSTASSETAPSFRLSAKVGDTQALAVDRAGALLENYGLVASSPLNAYLQSLLNNILQAAHAPADCCRVELLWDYSLWAESKPSGTIYVALGWLMQAEDEAELVALLAHETAHILYGHHDSDAMAALPTNLTHLSAYVAVAAKVFNMGQANSILNAVRNLGYASSATTQLLHPAWNREQEREADRFAIDMTFKLGYSMARGPKAMFERFEGLEARARELASAKPADKQGPWSDWIKSLDRRHDDARQRIADGVSYYEATWANQSRDPSMPRPQSRLQQVLAQPEVSPLLKAYREVVGANDELQQGRPKEAIKLARQAHARQSALLPALIQCDAFVALNDQQNAVNCFKSSMANNNGSWLPFRKFAEWQKRSGRAKDAIPFLENGFVMLGKPNELMPELVAFVHDVDKAKLNGYLKLCQGTSPMIFQSCVDNSNPEERKRKSEEAGKKIADKISAKLFKNLK